jgi:guanine deaminase
MDGHLLGIRGFLIDAPEFGTLRGRPGGAVIIDKGKILDRGDYDDLRRTHRTPAVEWIDHGPVAIFPGLIDCHTHLPQYAAVARGESELLPWLRQHVFPVEREFTGPKAREEAPQFFHELARHGTTTAMIYAAIYEDSCEVGFEAAKASGLRVILGKMMMDISSYGQFQPKKVLSISLVESERLCRKWHRAEDGRLEYAFSPRFAVTCSERLMRGAAELATRFDA